MIWFLRYDFFKRTFLSGPIPLINYQLHDNLLLHLISSSLAGTFATSNLLAPLLHLSVSSEYSQNTYISCLLTRGCSQISNNGFCALSTNLFIEPSNSFFFQSLVILQLLKFWENLFVKKAFDFCLKDGHRLLFAWDPIPFYYLFSTRWVKKRGRFYKFVNTPRTDH